MAQRAILFFIYGYFPTAPFNVRAGACSEQVEYFLEKIKKYSDFYCVYAFNLLLYRRGNWQIGSRNDLLSIFHVKECYLQ